MPAGTMRGAAVRAEGLVKSFRGNPRPALDGLDLSLEAGQVTAVLGPNGAGKTTLVRVLTTLTRPEAGRAEVAGFDVLAEPARVRRSVGLVGQNAAVDEVLGGPANLVMFGRLFHLTRAEARTRAAELLDRFGLTEAGDRPVGKYSGGMRRRLDLAAGLILDPPLLVLDEPTTGLDPRGRLEVWEAVRGLVGGGTTVLLTTQYLEEADQLADRVALVDGGRVVAEGSPEQLKARIGGDTLRVVLRAAGDLAVTETVLGRVARGPVEVDREALTLTVPVPDRMAALTGVVRGLDEAGVDPEDVGLRRPTLDDVFLRLTGRPSASIDEQQEVPA